MKAMFEVIKYEGDNSTLVYKYPVEDFNTKSRLVVQQAQEAILQSIMAIDCMSINSSLMNT